jgi:hypothetical protein
MSAAILSLILHVWLSMEGDVGPFDVEQLFDL